MNSHNILQNELSCSSKRRLLGAAVLPGCPSFSSLCFLGCSVSSLTSTSTLVPQPVDPGVHHPTPKGWLSVLLLPLSWKVLISFPISIPGCSFLSCLILPHCFLHHYYSYCSSYCHSLRVILIFHSLTPSPSPSLGLSLCLDFCSSPRDSIPPIPLSPHLVSVSFPFLSLLDLFCCSLHSES